MNAILILISADGLPLGWSERNSCLCIIFNFSKFPRSATCVFDFIINVKVRSILLLAIFNSRIYGKKLLLRYSATGYSAADEEPYVDMLLLLKLTTDAQGFFLLSD